MGILDDLMAGVQGGAQAPAVQQDPSQLNSLMPGNGTVPKFQPAQPQAPQLSPQAQGIKGYLSNIFYNMGEAAKAHLGMPTDVQVQQNQQRLNQTQQQIDQQGQLTQSQLQLHAAQIEQMKTTVPVRLPDGTVMSMPMALAMKVIPSSIGAQGKVQAAGVQAQNKIDVQNLKNQSPVTIAQAHLYNATADLKDAMNDPTSPAFGLALKKVQWANYYKQQALSMQKQRMAFQQQGPTASTRTQAQMAGGLLDHVDTIKQEIANLGAQGKLGPLNGRFNEFMAGKVGNGDPDYVSLRTSLGLFQTALMKAHVGSRGSEMMMHHFQSLIDAGKMSPEALDSAMDSITQYLNTYVKMGQFNPQAAPGVAPAPQSTPSAGDPFAAFGGKKR